VTEHERTAEKAVFLIVVTGLLLTCLLGLVLAVALIARGDPLAGVVVLAVDSAWIHQPDLDDGFLIVVGVGGRLAGSGRVCPAGLPVCRSAGLSKGSMVVGGLGMGFR